MRFLRFALLALSFLLAPLCGHTQETASDETPEANPARPTVSTPATLTPVGYLQFENGGLYATNTTEFDQQSGINQVTKLAVNSRLQFLMLAQPYAHSSVGPLEVDDPGDIFLGFQTVAFKGTARRPTFAASYIRRIYEGTAPNVDIGSFKQCIILLVSADPLGFHVDTNGIVAEQVDGRLRRAQFGQTLSISHPVGKFTLAGEIWHFSQPLTGGNAVGNLWAISYPLKKYLIFDAGFDHGFTSTSTQWEGFAGLTYVLPHRLWKERKPLQQQ